MQAVEMLKVSPAVLWTQLIIDECQDLSSEQIDVAMEIMKSSRPAVFTVGVLWRI